MAAGDRVNDPDLDWRNIAEEIESVVRSQLSAVRSLLTQALLHMLKIAAWPQTPYVPGWRAEVTRFRQDAAEAFSPSMLQYLAVAHLYTHARARLPDTIDGQRRLPVPETYSVYLDDLLQNDALLHK
jgi:hypothetical protein